MLDIKTIKRRIIDFLWKYATEKQVLFIAEYLGISAEDKEKEK